MKPHYRILRLNHGRAPTVQHATLKEAETEALRLAGQHPGETFEILQCLGIARTTEPAVFWNDGVEPPAPGKGQEGWDPRPAPESGYRILEPGEVIEEGDEFFTGDYKWIAWTYSIGTAVGGHTPPTRRPILKPTKTTT